MTVFLVWINFLIITLAAVTGNEQAETGVRWRDLSASISRDGTTILQPSSGFIPSGHLCGIIGPSGSGKSTFLAALGGVTPNHSGLMVSGNVWWQGANLTKSTLSLKDGQVAWLQQHDAFFGMLTTREAVEMAAFLEFPNLSKSERDELVDSSLDALGLKKVQNRLIGDRTLRQGGLSGGEKRRLSVALELLSTPLLFLADECTTGLDSSQAFKVVKLIQQLAQERHIPCIASLHQPRASIWRMLDSFILLGPGGRLCYMGKRQDAKPYFAKLGYKCPPETNPAEYFIDLVSIDTEDPDEAARDEARIEDLAAAFARHMAEEEKLHGSESVWQLPRSKFIQINLTNGSFRPLRWIRRSMALLRRSWRQNIRNNKVNALRLVAAVGNSFLFSQIFATVKKGVPTAKSIADRVALLSFGVINMSMMALMKTIDLFARERPVVEREQMRSQYSSLEYLLSKAIAELPLDVFFAAAFTTMLKALTGLRIPLAQLTATFSLMTVAGAALGFAIGSSTPTAESAMATGIPVIVIFMVVGIINPSGVDTSHQAPLYLKYLRWASPIHWAVEALCLAEYRGMKFEDKTARWPWQRFRDLPKIGGLAMVRNGDQVLAALGLADASYDNVMKNLAVLSGINLLLSWIGLHFTGTSFEQAQMADWAPTTSHHGSHKTMESSSIQTNGPITVVPVGRNL